MVVIVVERVSESLRGELTRWLLEPKTGVFVGSISAMVRERLWEKVAKGVKEGGGLLIHSADTEQGYRIVACGRPGRELVDFEGLALVRRPV